MENEQVKKRGEEVINLSEFDLSKEAAEKSSGEPAKESAQNSFGEAGLKQRRSLGYYLSAITDMLSESDFSSDEKKKRRNVIIVIVNFLLMFLILGYYFYGNRTVSNNENAMLPAEEIGGETSPNNP